MSVVVDLPIKFSYIIRSPKTFTQAVHGLKCRFFLYAFTSLVKMRISEGAVFVSVCRTHWSLNSCNYPQERALMPCTITMNNEEIARWPGNFFRFFSSPKDRCRLGRAGLGSWRDFSRDRRCPEGAAENLSRNSQNIFKIHEISSKFHPKFSVISLNNYYCSSFCEISRRTNCDIY